MAKKKIAICLRYVAASLLKRVGISGLIGAGIGLAYTPLSYGLICMAYAYEGKALADIISLPALPFFFFASYMQLPAVPFFIISIVFWTFVGVGVGLGIRWIKNLIK